MADQMVQSGESGSEELAGRLEQTRAGGSLPRRFGFFAVMVFALSSMGLSISGLLPFSAVVGLWPGSSLVVILIVALVVCLFHAYTYAVIGSAAPFPGADYYLANRSFSGPLAFASSLTFVVFSAVFAGTLIAQIPLQIVPLFVRMYGLLINRIPAIIRLEESVRTPENVVNMGTIFVVATFLLTLLPSKIVKRILLAGVFLSLAAWGMILVILATSSAPDFPIAWDRVMGAGSYLNHQIQARSLGLDMQMGGSYTLLAGLFVSFWLFFGYSTPALIAGEVKNPGRSLLGGSLLALLLAWGILLGSSALMLRLAPAEWLAAESYLYQSGSNINAMPWIIFYAAVLRPNVVLLGFLFVSWIFALVTLVQAYFFFCSRVITSWVADGLLPAVIGYIHPNLSSPLMAVLLVGILTLVGVVFASASVGSPARLNFVFFVAAVQLVPVLAITLFPFTRREWFRSSAPLVRLKLGPVPVITLVGSLTFVYLVWLLVSTFLTPVFGGVSMESLVSFLVVFVGGLVWYAARQMALKSKPEVGQGLEEPSTL